MRDITFDAYHGSVEWKAQKISDNGFLISDKKTEWLGSGIYFFGLKEHAVIWAKKESEKPQNFGHRPAVLVVTIKCNEDELFDLDISDNMSSLIECFFNTFNGAGKGKPKFKDAKQHRCFCCNLFRLANPQYKVFSFSFPFYSDNPVGFRETSYQTQYCVASNDYICIESIEVYDNAI